MQQCQGWITAEGGQKRIISLTNINMPTGINPFEPMYIKMFLDTLSRWRKFLCYFFESKRVSKKEYLDWFYGGMKGAKFN